jgi:hypothetical protein
MDNGPQSRIGRRFKADTRPRQTHTHSLSLPPCPDRRLTTEARDSPFHPDRAYTNMQILGLSVVPWPLMIRNWWNKVNRKRNKKRLQLVFCENQSSGCGKLMRRNWMARNTTGSTVSGGLGAVFWYRSCSVVRGR